jgi:IclR family transcriptional regulator, pca regulon regulatory protein
VPRARAQGYWFTAGQLDAGLTRVSVALRDRRGRCVAAISMTVQTLQWTPERITAQLLPALEETAQNMRPVL